MLFSRKTGVAALLLPIVAAAMAAAQAVAQEPGEPAELADMKAAFNRLLGEQAALYRKTTANQPEVYEEDLRLLCERLQKGGDLDGFLAADKELKRFRKAMGEERDPFEANPEMPASALVAAPAELRALQDRYLKSFRDAAAARQKNISDITAQYLARLRELQKDLTIRNRIDDALAVRTEVDRIQKALDGKTLDTLAESLADAAATEGRPAATAAGSGKASDEDPIPTYGRVPAWATWKFVGVKNFALEGMLVGHPDIPDELNADWDQRRNSGFFKGRCASDKAIIDMFDRAWLGKALVWRVGDPSILQATIELESGELSTGRDSGPHARLAILDSNRKVLRAISIPLMSKSATLRIGYNKAENRCGLNWLQGKKTESFTLPGNGPFLVLLGVCVRQPGEECATTFTLK